MAGLTPMMQQYLSLKQQYPDCLLMFRLGDFYELFFEDAKTASRELDIVLTGRDGGLNERIPMCGVPYHALDSYLARLLEKGYRVAIADQMEDPAQAHGLVDRQVTRVITPGTVTDDTLLKPDVPNYLVSVVAEDGSVGLAYVDVSAGDFMVAQYDEEAETHLVDELFRLRPAEILVAPALELEGPVAAYKEKVGDVAVTKGEEKWFSPPAADERLKGQWPEENFDRLPALGKTAAGAILLFLDHTQKRQLHHLHPPLMMSEENVVKIDLVTRRNLELTRNLRDGRREGTLFEVLDHCLTAGGRRLLAGWLEQPLLRIDDILIRHEAVEELLSDRDLRNQLDGILDQTHDLERIAARLGGQTASPRDLAAIRDTLAVLPQMTSLATRADSRLLKELLDIDPLTELYQLLVEALTDDLPVSPLQGGIIRAGFNQQVDELRVLSADASCWLLDYERREKERTGIKSLKVGYNKVFGYYLEITKANLDAVPPDYVRKQTLVSGERFITEELKEFENKILGAKEKLTKLEYEIFIDIRQRTAACIDRLQAVARSLSQLDCLSSLAKAAYYNDYVRPNMVDQKMTIIKNGRHPVVEKSLNGERFVPNDCELTPERFLAVITGPNMGGKSTYMRQVALIHIMAQVGSFVPAEEATLGIVDRVFARVGASDDLVSGRSTFMVEMTEVAVILNQATPRSLVLLDEIGRGTSTYDGMSIARAVLEEMAERIKSRTLFATHYHELTSLEKIPGVFNLFVSVLEQGERVIFLRKVLPGKADRSYGIEVARLAGIPSRVVERARAVLREMERKGDERKQVFQPSLFGEEDPLREEIRKINPDEITPLMALQLLYKWKSMIG